MSKDNIHVLSRGVVVDQSHILLCKTIGLSPNFYFLPGGHIEPGESANDALLRELTEETGAKCTVRRFLGCLEYSFDPTNSNICHNHEYNFVFEVKSDELKIDRKIPQLEADIELLWIPLGQLPDIDFRAEPLRKLVPQWIKSIPSDVKPVFWSELLTKVSDLTPEQRTSEESNIIEELKAREPIFHHPEKFGKTKEDIEAQMCDEFWEVGASGNIYSKQYVIETLLERYNDPNYQDIWEASDFKVTEIAPGNYLLTYNLIQNKTRYTRRSTIWRKVNDQWKVLYHQGTVVEGSIV